MNILINGIAIRGGGPETFLLGLLPQLTSLDPHSTFDVILPKSRSHLYQEILSSRVTIRAIPDSVVESSQNRFWYEHVAISKLQIVKNYSVYFRADELLSPLSRFLITPSVIVYHATQHMLRPDLLDDSCLKMLYINFIKRRAMEIATIPITVSHFTKLELESLYPSASNRIEVVYHGINHQLFSTVATGQASTLVGSQRYILSVSDRHPHKNLCMLVEAYGRLCAERHIEEHLVLVGRAKSAKEEERLRELMSTFNLNERVHLHEYVEQTLLPDLYRGASLYVFPSIFETFGLTPLEAMACGVPVVCSSASVIPEICGEAVEYFDPYDVEELKQKIELVLNNPARKRELVHLGLERSNRFTWQKAAHDYYNLLLKAAKGKK